VKSKALTPLKIVVLPRIPIASVRTVITIDGAAVFYTCALVLLVGVAVGLVPALQATGTRLQDTLKTDSRTASSSRRAVVARSVLVVAQLAVSVMLLVGALHLRIGERRTRARAQPCDAQHQMDPSVVQGFFRNRQRRPHGDAIGANAA
jgi:hypothetical protein